MLQEPCEVDQVTGGGNKQALLAEAPAAAQQVADAEAAASMPAIRHKCIRLLGGVKDGS